MRALVVIPEIDFKGGGERVTYKAAQVLAEEGIKFDILTNAFFTEKKEILTTLYETFGEHKKFEKQLDEIHTIESMVVKKLFKHKYKEAIQLRKASKLHKKNRYDFIITHYSNIHFLPKFEGAKVLYFLGPGPGYKGSLLFELAKKLYFSPYWMFNKLSTAKKSPSNYEFIAVSSFVRKKFKKRFPDFKFDIINPPVDIENFKYQGEDKKDKITYFSRITPDKRNHLLVEVAEEFKELNWKFLIIGSLRESEKPYYDEIIDKIKKKDLSDKIMVKKNVPFDELLEELKSSKIAVHLAKNESMPATPIEAMAAGNVVITHKSGGPWNKIIKKGEFGYGWEDLGKLINKIKNLTNKETLKKERKKAMKRADDFGGKIFRKKLKEKLDLNE